MTPVSDAALESLHATATSIFTGALEACRLVPMNLAGDFVHWHISCECREGLHSRFSQLAR